MDHISVERHVTKWGLSWIASLSTKACLKDQCALLAYKLCWAISAVDVWSFFQTRLHHSHLLTASGLRLHLTCSTRLSAMF